MPEKDNNGVKTPFFCQLDNERHPATDDRYQCIECGRLVCASCFEAQKCVSLCPCQKSLYMMFLVMFCLRFRVDFWVVKNNLQISSMICVNFFRKAVHGR